MSKLFGNLKADGLEKATDRLGGGGNEPLPTALYLGTIKVAYGTKSPGGAHGVVLVLEVDGREVRETVWITKKTGETFFPDKDDPKKKIPLPGFTLMNDLAMFCTEEGILEQESETKVVKVYDYDQQREIPTEVPVLTGFTGKKFALGILREIHDKRKKDASAPSGYVDVPGEVRFQNQIDKAFHPETLKTIVEYEQEVPEAIFAPAWKEKNTGVDRDRRKNPGAAANAGGNPSGTGRPGGNTGTGQPVRKKLFDKPAA